MGYLNREMGLMTDRLTSVQDDEQLIRSLASGESAAIHHLYQSCYPMVEKMVFRMNGSVDDAYDIFQDSITILYEKAKAGDFILTSRLSTYLTAVAKNLWLKKLNQKRNRPFSVLQEDLEEISGAGEDAQHFFEMEHQIRQLQLSFREIGEPCKNLLTAFYLQNKSMQQIADELGYTNPENAKNQKYKCLNRLRKLFFKEKKLLKNERVV